MEKKVRYLMLLLCLFLFPIRVFALEGDLEGEQEKQENIVENISNNENETNLEDLEKIEDPENVLLLGEESDNEEEEKEGEEPSEEEKEEGEITTKKVVNEEEKVEGEEEEEEQAPGETTIEEEPTVTATELSTITLTGVNTSLMDNATVTFSGTSGESDKYTLEREEWVNYYYNGEGYQASYSTSDPTANADYQAQGMYFDTPTEGATYDYYVLLKLADGYSLPEELTAYVNGNTYDAYSIDYDEEENTYYVDIYLTVQGQCGSAEFVDSLAVENAILDAYLGQAPLYGASVATDHFTSFGEVWYGYRYVEYEDGSYDYYSAANASNAALLFDYETFSQFESGIGYQYFIIIKADQGYRLTPVMIDGEETYNVTINGQSVDSLGGYIGADYLFEDGVYYYWVGLPEVEATEAATYEVTENPDPVMELEELDDTTIGVDGDFSTFDNAYVDGNLVEKENYTVDTTNNAITFIKSFLQTLAQGVHNVALHFTDGHMAYTTLTINGPEEETTTNNAAQQVSYEEEEEEPTTGTIEEDKTEKKEDKKDDTKEKKDEKEKEKSNIGLIIFLIILILIAIAIPITVYRKKQD